MERWYSDHVRQSQGRFFLNGPSGISSKKEKILIISWATSGSSEMGAAEKPQLPITTVVAP